MQLRLSFQMARVLSSPLSEPIFCFLGFARRSGHYLNLKLLYQLGGGGLVCPGIRDRVRLHSSHCHQILRCIIYVIWIAQFLIANSKLLARTIYYEKVIECACYASPIFHSKIRSCLNGMWAAFHQNVLECAIRSKRIVATNQTLSCMRSLRAHLC